MSEPKHRTERDWKKYHQDNTTCGDCQVVTAVNAYYFLTGKVIKQTSKRYAKLVDLAGARHGSATTIGKVWKRLGLEVVLPCYSPVAWRAGSKREPYDYHLHTPLPFEVCVHHKRTGFHSVCVVDFEPVTRSFRVAGFPWETNMEGWIYAEDLDHFLVLNPDLKEPRWRFRSFTLLGRE